MLTLIAVILALVLLPDPWGWVVVGIAVAIDALEIIIWLRWRGRSSMTGASGMLGARATALTACRPEGRVQVSGQIWKARCAEGAESGDEVVVTAVDGLVLSVEHPSEEPVRSKPA